MNRVGILFLFLITLSGTKSFAFTCNVHPGRIEVGVGHIDLKQTQDLCFKEINEHRRFSTVIVLSSYGGRIDQIPDVLTAIDDVVTLSKKRSGKTPVVIVREYCMSSCVPVLSALNYMASQNQIILIVDSATKIGFHGASIETHTSVVDANSKVPDAETVVATKEYSQSATLEYEYLLSMLGVPLTWIVDHEDLFASDTPTVMDHADVRLNGSNILDHAEFHNTNFFFYGYPNFNLDPSNYKE